MSDRIKFIQKFPYWINLDPLVDIAALLALHPILCRAVALAPHQLLYGDQRPPNPEDNIYQSHHGIGYATSLLHILPDDHPEKQATKDMTILQKQYYLALRCKSRCEGELISLISRRPGSDSMALNSVRKDKVRTVAYPYFHEFFDWLDAQKIFTEYGRSNVFILPPFQHLEPHCDRNDNIEDAREFIWVRTTLDKNLSIWNKDAEELPALVRGYVVWFNGGQWHCAQPCDYMTFSIRVDGIFTPQFRRKIRALRKKRAMRRAGVLAKKQV